MNRNHELAARRDEYIYALYKELLESGGYSTSAQVFQTIASLPAPHHYVDARTAARQFAVIRRGRTLTCEDRRRWYFLYRRWLAMKGNGRKSLEQACEELLSDRAPSLYLSESAVKKIVLRERKKEREALYEKVL